jgi:hypothetical protein
LPAGCPAYEPALSTLMAAARELLEPATTALVAALAALEGQQ